MKKQEWSGEFWSLVNVTGSGSRPPKSLFLIDHTPFMMSADVGLSAGRFFVAARSTWPDTQTTEVVALRTRVGLYLRMASWNTFWAGVSSRNQGKVAMGVAMPSLLGSSVWAEVSGASSHCGRYPCWRQERVSREAAAAST